MLRSMKKKRDAYRAFRDEANWKLFKKQKKLESQTAKQLLSQTQEEVERE